MPFLSLQPLVENAIEHGLLPKAEGGSVELNCDIYDSVVHIRIQDNGVGIEPDILQNIRKKLKESEIPLQGEYVGLCNSARRYYHHYKGDVSFSIESTLNEGTTVDILISNQFELTYI